ncbi:MAG: hypothetical protein ACJ790_10675 [Myxococcaceae bacterium]
MTLLNERSKTLRSVFLSVMSICGSVAACVWLLTSDVAMAEVKQTAKAAVGKIAAQKTDDAQKKPPVKKKRLIKLMGSYEGY